MDIDDTDLALLDDSLLDVNTYSQGSPASFRPEKADIAEGHGTAKVTGESPYFKAPGVVLSRAAGDENLAGKQAGERPIVKKHEAPIDIKKEQKTIVKKEVKPVVKKEEAPIVIEEEKPFVKKENSIVTKKEASIRKEESGVKTESKTTTIPTPTTPSKTTNITPTSTNAPSTIKRKVESEPADEEEPKKKKTWADYKNRSGPTALGSKELPVGEEGCLTGMTFVLTGELSSISRDNAKALAERFGGYGLCFWSPCFFVNYLAKNVC